MTTDDLRAELDYVRRLSPAERIRFRRALEAAESGEPETIEEYARRLNRRERDDFRAALDRVERGCNPTGDPVANVLRLTPGPGDTLLTGTVPHVGPDALEAWTLAEWQARPLAPEGCAPQFLAEAIWLRTLAVGPPTDAEVVDYLARCAADHRPVSGRAEHEPGISPLEVYTVGRPVVEVRRRGRSEYAAVLVVMSETGDTARRDLCTAKSRAKIHRKVEAVHPAERGVWRSRLLSSEVAEIRRAWGLADEDRSA